MNSHFDRLASAPRPAGSAAATDAQRYCAEVLEALGYSVTPRPFEFSAFTGSGATPLAGLWMGAALTIAAFLARSGRSGTALMALIVAITLLITAGRYLATSGVLSLPALRRHGVNIEAVRGERAPAVWLVAHIDSKWQPVPMAVRAAGITLLGVATIAAFVLSAIQWRTGAGRELWVPLLVVGWLGALPVMMSFVGRRGPGAVDNASGVATVLTAAELLDVEASVGILITDAEELGLAGARAWVGERATSSGIALNCDGVDDEGTLTAMYSGRRPVAVLATLRDVAGRENQGLRSMRMIPGVLTDSVAFAAAGWTTATLSRGSLRTLRRIHTMSDSAAAMRGTGIAMTARVLADAAESLAAR